MKLALNYYKIISGVDRSYEFNAKDHKFIQRNCYHSVKPL